MISYSKKSKLSLLLLLISIIQLGQSNIRRISPSTSTINGNVAGIILSFHSGHSYDQLFTKHTQKSLDGVVVITYLADKQDEKQIVEALNGNYQNSDLLIRQFVGQVNQLSEKCPTCIVFNWQCSSGFANSKFDYQKGRYVFQLLDIIIKRGFFAMFSDFSLKALIKEWNSEVLGVNPFVQVGETSDAIKLGFNKNQLLRSGSTQLSAAAQLSEKNLITVNVLGGTILYGVNSQRKETDKYKLQVLTIASNFRAPNAYLESSIDQFSGLAGHVLLSYKQGGKLLTSMGHWVQLLKIHTTEQKLFQASEKYYGSAQTKRMKKQYGSLKSKQQKDSYLLSSSNKMVQQQLPGSNAQL